MPILLILLAVACLAGSVTFSKLVNDTTQWRPATGTIRENETNRRLIVFRVGKGTYTTSNESAVDWVASKAGFEYHFRAGASKTRYNGVDPEIGRSITVYYNPNNPAEAVVEKGWSVTTIILLLCTGAPFLISAFGAMNGWESTDYDPFNN